MFSFSPACPQPVEADMEAQNARSWFDPKDIDVVERRAISISRLNADFACESFRTPIETHVAFHLPNHALHYTRAEAASRGGRRRRTTCFGPAKHNSTVDRT